MQQEVRTTQTRRSWEGLLAVDAVGRLEPPTEVALRYGLTPAARVYAEAGENGLVLHRPVTNLARTYVEPTDACNLECRTSVRRVCDEPLGTMEMRTFQRVVAAYEGGARTELVINGVLLDERGARGLIEARLAMFWVSLDGATPESYLDETHRRSQAYFVGSLEETPLRAIWQQPEYVRLRERLREFDFSPCATCNSCEMAEANVEDRFGSELPACGGCLWAQGFIRCP